MTKSVLTSPAISRHSNGDFFWTVDRYHLAIDNGIFGEDDKVELIHGKIVNKMPAGAPHEECITLLAEYFRDRFGKQFRYRQEKSINLAELASEPEPDFAVVKDKKYGTYRPAITDIYLLIEVANTSLDKDRSRKAELYAQAGLPEYWIVNLADRQIEVHLQPQPEQGRYGSLITYAEQDTFTSPFAGKVTVAELLPDPTAPAPAPH